MFKPFKPNDIPPLSHEEISRLFQKGDFHNAFKQFKKSGCSLNEFQNDIEAGARKLLISHRPTELLGYIYKHGINVQYNISTLLVATFDVGDYHGFLKNAYRFKTYQGLEDKIEFAIDHLIKKGQIADAQGWRQKLLSLKELN